MQRAYKAGVQLANVIIEMVHLMYQNTTAINFYRGLKNQLSAEMVRRINNSRKGDEKNESKI